MSFLGELCIELKPGSEKVWILTESLSYYSPILKRWVLIRAGFETDLSSVPRVPFVFWFWGGRAHREGVLHDALYRSDSDPIVSFSKANRVFLEAMKSRGKPMYVRYPMYLGVVAGGYWSYHKRLVGDSL